MRTALYDGSIEGLLCVIDCALRTGCAPDEVAVKDEFAGDLFAEVTDVATDERTASETLSRLRGRLGNDMTGDILFAFLSDAKDLGRLILRFALDGWKRGPSARGDLSDPAALEVRKIVRRVKGEAHRFCGLVRFRELADGTLYAPVNPDNDIIMLTARHFRARLSGEKWVIHDVKRGKAAVYDGARLEETEFEFVPGAGPEDVPLAPGEKFYRGLWKAFYKSIANEERRNWRCRARYMPKKYWAYLPEVEE